MFRITRDPSSVNCTQCLAKIFLIFYNNFNCIYEFVHLLDNKVF